MDLLSLHSAVCLAVSLLPVIVFLVVLVLSDSYQLVRMSTVVTLMLSGCLIALLCLVGFLWLRSMWELEGATFARYVAPPLEELLKGSVVVYLIKRNRLGFMVDAVICGFAIGAGFATVENLYYYLFLLDPNLLLWLVRGFGTAVMHGGVTASMAVTSKHLSERSESTRLWVFIPGLLLAMAVHSAFNHFFLSPDLSTVALLIVLPAVFVLVYRASETAVRQWLGIGFDTDSELLELVNSGRISETRVGRYLESLKAKLPGTAVADTLCLVRVHLELSIHAKGILLMRKAGFTVPRDPEVEERFEELRYLERSIGKVGMLALSPIFNVSSHDLWQFHMLGKK